MCCAWRRCCCPRGAHRLRSASPGQEQRAVTRRALCSLGASADSQTVRVAFVVSHGRCRSICLLQHDHPAPHPRAQPRTVSEASLRDAAMHLCPPFTVGGERQCFAVRGSGSLVDAAFAEVTSRELAMLFQSLAAEYGKLTPSLPVWRLYTRVMALNGTRVHRRKGRACHGRAPRAPRPAART
jgi:hypothetical protein